jgi:photosystem II stability/assembly factor-like uncharacterized protein
MAVPLSSLAAPPASSRPYLWRNVEIGGGGFVSGIVFHPTQRELIYARTDVGGSFRWDPNHQAWTPLNDALGSDSASLLGVVSLAVDPGNPNLVYLACGQYTQPWEKKSAAILWSTDRGVTWSQTALPFKLGGNEDGRSAGERLQVDPNHGGILFLGTNHDGLWTSADHHLSLWDRVDGFPAHSVTFVLFDQRSGRPGRPTPTIYAGSSDGQNGLFRSTDGGKTWAAVPGQPGGMIPQHAALDARGVLYLTYANHLGPNGITDGRVGKFNPADGTWTDISPLQPNQEDKFGYAGLALDPQRPGTLLVTTLDRWTKGDEIFRSTDGGATWIGLCAKATWDHSPAPYVAKLKPHWMGAVDLDPFNSDRAIVVTGYGVWMCDNLTAADAGGPTHWVFQDHGLEETVLAALVSPPAGAPLVSAIYDITGFRHDTLDVSPPRGAFDPVFRSCYSIDFAAKKPAQLALTHAGGSQRGSYSLDGGTSWASFASSPPPALSNGPGAIAIAADGCSLVWLPKGSTPFYSLDNGATWRKSRGGPTSAGNYQITRPTADREDPRKFYIYDLVKGRLWISVDGGATFGRTAPKLPADGGSLGCVFGYEGDLWLPTGAGLYRSVDSGANFVRLASVQAASQVGFGRAAPGREYPAVYLCGKVDEVEGIFRSDDAGTSWVLINDRRHRFGEIRTIIGDPRTYGRVYLGTGGRGIIYGDPPPANP